MNIKPVSTESLNIKYNPINKKSLTESELIKASAKDLSIINKVTKNEETEMFDVNSTDSVIIDHTKMSKIEKATQEIEQLKKYYKSQGIPDELIKKILAKSLTQEETIKINTIIYHNMGFTDNDIKRLLSGEITYESLIKEIQNDKDTSRLEKLIQANMLSDTGFYTLEEVENAVNELDLKLQNNINSCTNQEQKYYMQQVLNMLKNGTSLNDALNSIAVPYDLNSPYTNLNYGTLLTGENKNMLTEIYNQKQQLLADKEYVKAESKNYAENVLKYQLNSDYSKNTGQNKNDTAVLNGILNQATPDASSPGNYQDYYVTDTKQKVAILSALINGDNSVTNGGAYVNGVPISSNTDEVFNHYRQWYGVMTDEEKQTFNYIYNTKGADAAYKYLQTESLQNSLDQRYYYQKQQNDSTWAKDNAVAASALSVVMTPVEGLGSMLSTNGTLLHNTITGDNKGIFRSDNISTGTNYRGAISQDILKNHGILAQFAYDAGMSMADFAVVAAPTMATGGAAIAGTAGTTMLFSNMGTRVYVSAFNDAKDRGLSDADAVKEAWAYAAIETAIEKIPLKNLSKLSKMANVDTLTSRATKAITERALKNVTNPNTARRLTKAINITGSIVSQSIVEGNEELATDIIDSIVDNYIAKDKSTFNLKVDEYISKGYSEDEAIAKAMQDTAVEWARDWALGFVSGTGFGAAAGTVNNYRSNNQNLLENITNRTKAIAGNFKSAMFDQNLYLVPPFMSKIGNVFGGDQSNETGLTNNGNIDTSIETLEEKTKRYEELLSDYECVQLYKGYLTGQTIYFTRPITEYQSWVDEYDRLSQELNRNDIKDKIEEEQRQIEEYNKKIEQQLEEERIRQEEIRKIEEEKRIKKEKEKKQRVDKYVEEALSKVTKPGELTTLEEKINRINEIEKDKTFMFSYYYRTPSGKMVATKAYGAQKEEYERLKADILEETGLGSAFDYMMNRYGNRGEKQINLALQRLNKLGTYDAFSRINGDGTRSFWKRFTPEQLQQIYDIYSSKISERIDDSWFVTLQTYGILDFDEISAENHTDKLENNENKDISVDNKQQENLQETLSIGELKELVTKGINATELNVPMEYTSIEEYKTMIIETVLENNNSFTDENIELFAQVLTDSEMTFMLFSNEKFQHFIIQSFEKNPSYIAKLLPSDKLYLLYFYLKKPKILEYLSSLNQMKKNKLINDENIGNIIDELDRSYVISCKKIAQLSNFEFGFSEKNGFVIKNQQPGQYFTITYNDGGHQGIYKTKFMSNANGELSLEGLFGKSGLLRRARYGEVTIESVEVNREKSKLIFDLSGINENAIQIEVLIDGRKKLYTILKGDNKDSLVDLNTYGWLANPDSVEIVSFKPFNIDVDNAYLFETTSLDFDGNLTTQYISVEDLESSSEIKILENLKVTPISQSEALERFPQVKNELILSDNKYGGNQSDVAVLVAEYFASPIIKIKRKIFNKGTRSIRQQKSELLVSKIKEYYPEATDIEMINLANAYASVGCGYMAVANTFALYMSSLPNGESFFYDNFGFPLSFSDNGKISYNLEAIAFDLFLYTQKEVYNYNDINDAIQEADGTGPLLVKNSFIPYFTKHNVKLDYIYEDIDLDSNQQADLIGKIISNDGFHVLGSRNFDMIKQSDNNTSVNLDSALLLDKITGNYVADCGGHAMLITDVSDDMELIVSSWSDKYKFLFDSVTKNKQKGNKKDKASYIGIGTFRYSNIDSNSEQDDDQTSKSLTSKINSDRVASSIKPQSSSNLYDAKTMPLSEDELRRSAQQKILDGADISSLDVGEKMKLGTRSVIKEIDGYELKSDHVYRAISKELYQIYLDEGYIKGPNENDEYIPGENNAGVDWFLGGVSNRYGEVIIECPADKDYFMPTLDNGNGLAKDPLVRHMKSSGSANPVPMSMIKVIKHPDYGIIDNNVLQEQLTKAKQELDEYVEGNNTTLKDLGKSNIQIDVEDVKSIIKQKADEIMDISKREEESVTKIMETLQDNRAHLVGLDKKLKERDSLIRKITTDLSEGEYLEDDIVDNIYDALRYTLIIDDAAYLEKVTDSLNQLQKQGFEIIEVKNKWGKEYYQGINVKLKTPTGARFELQFHTEKSYQAKEGDTHLYYEIARNKTNKLVTEEISKKANNIQRYYQGLVSRPKGVLDYKYNGG